MSVKGLLRDALLNSKYVVVLDHLARPSQSLAAAIRELMLNWSVPTIAVSRSADMEDVGFVLPLFADRSEKLALRNFDPGNARQFAAAFAEHEGLTAGNLAQFLEKVGVQRRQSRSHAAHDSPGREVPSTRTKTRSRLRRFTLTTRSRWSTHDREGSAMSNPEMSNVEDVPVVTRAANAVPADGQALGRLAEIAEALGESSIRGDVQQLAARISEGRFDVACVGQFKRGKSTLLDALVGEPICLPALYRSPPCPPCCVMERSDPRAF